LRPCGSGRTATLATIKPIARLIGGLVLRGRKGGIDYPPPSGGSRSHLTKVKLAHSRTTAWQSSRRQSGQVITRQGHTGDLRPTDTQGNGRLRTCSSVVAEVTAMTGHQRPGHTRTSTDQRDKRGHGGHTHRATTGFLRDILDTPQTVDANQDPPDHDKRGENNTNPTPLPTRGPRPADTGAGPTPGARCPPLQTPSSRPERGQLPSGHAQRVTHWGLTHQTTIWVRPSDHAQPPLPLIPHRPPHPRWHQKPPHPHHPP